MCLNCARDSCIVKLIFIESDRAALRHESFFAQISPTYFLPATRGESSGGEEGGEKRETHRGCL
jgi:hypothetical protein